MAEMKENFCDVINLEEGSGCFMCHCGMPVYIIHDKKDEASCGCGRKYKIEYKKPKN